MKNNKTLAKLQAEIDLIKSSKGKTKAKTKVQPITETHRSSVAHDIKNSYIQNLHMKSSMFMLWLGTAVLSYAHKIPYIKHIITALSVMYGRTTIWKVLVKLRKIFIMFNAVIGVYMVFKTTGFSYDNILAGFAGMGHSYLEIFTNFTKRLFHWFVELFDHKIVPNIPGDKPLGSNKNIWLPKGIESNSFYPKPNVETSLRDSYKSLFNISVEPAPTRWYRELSSWLWVGGVVVGGAVVVGTVYVIYKFIQDPSFILFLGNSEGTAGADVGNPNITTNVTPASPEEVFEGSKVFAITKLIVRGVGNNLKKLNPTYWFLTSTDTTVQAREFMTQQATAKYKLPEFYPYTNINPYDSWVKRMRISWLGETTAEITGRESLKREFLDVIVGPAAVVAENVASGSNITLHGTPHVATVGLGLTLDSGFMDVANKVASLPTTPGGRLSHTILPDLANPFDGMESSLLNNSPVDELDEVVSSTALADSNRYNVLDEEMI